MLTIYEERGIIKGKRNMLLRQMRKKFGELPEAVVMRLQAIQADEELDQILDRVLEAHSLAEIGLPDDHNA
jgi:hypothetical protein